jgi:DMSO/TMAO reductase YedYZ molybdopterin-dependent catalytic subunit
MAIETTRREILKTGLGAMGLGVLGVPDWVLPALAQGEEVVAFSDIPANFNTGSGERRILDTRTIDGPITPADQFFTTQHYGIPDVDLASYRLRISGLVQKPLSLSIDDLKAIGSTEQMIGFECSGNRGPIQGLSGNGRWTGVSLKTVLDRAGVKPEARTFIFFGTDRKEENVEFRGRTSTVVQQFGRSLTREQALAPEPLLVWALNGAPLSDHQGRPLRLIVPGWYSVANVKWLSEIFIQEDEYLGNFQARWYRTLKGVTIDGETHWIETAVTRMHLKSFVARLTHAGPRYTALGVVLNDGTPIKAVEVKVDDGPWQPATLDPATSAKYAWKLFRYSWNSPAPGEHTIVSRVTDVNGQVQPTAEDLADKKTFLEENSQSVRKFTVA